MSIIEPAKMDLQHPLRKKKYSWSLRLWHWLNAIVISGSLLTVLIDSTLLKKRKNTVLIKNELHDAGVSITDAQAKSVSHAINDKVWELHTYIGYILAGLVAFRLILELFQVADQKLIRKMKTAYRDYYVIKQNREIAFHEFWVKTLYAVFYIMIIVMAITGLCLAFEDDYEWLHSIHAFRQVHAFTMYLILAFIVIHIAGVFLGERKRSKGITSDMINGG
jgi:Ni/Fe-hydrogenase 1 B-type cytochrome subunit